MRIGSYEITESSPVFIIAELSANHNGSLENALASVKAAKRAGANAIKIQTYTADTITLNCSNEFFQLKHGTLWDGKTLHQLYQEAYTPWEWHEKIFQVAKEENILCFSTPFDKSAVDFLEQFNPPAYKIASFEINDIPLIRYAASKGKPMIISTGIADLSDIELAVKTCKEAGNDQIALLKCTSEYPAPIEGANLRTIQNIRETFNVEVGISDHSMDSPIPVVSVALGAKIIEKHFILDRSIGGPDSAFSLNTDELAKLVQDVRDAEKALGKVTYELSENSKIAKSFSRSIFVSNTIKAGEVFTEQNIKSVRPGQGLHTKYFDEIIGRKASRDLELGTPLKWEYIL